MNTAVVAKDLDISVMVLTGANGGECNSGYEKR